MVKFLIPLAFFISFSVRTPNIQPNPFDFEIRGGCSNENYEIWALWERENGNYYIGHKEILTYKFVEFENFYKEAKDINAQSLKFFGSLFKFRAGISLTWDKWADMRPCLYLAYKPANVGFELESSGLNNNNFKFWLEHTIKSCSLRFEYNLVNGKEDFWFKTVFKWRVS